MPCRVYTDHEPEPGRPLPLYGEPVCRWCGDPLVWTGRGAPPYGVGRWLTLTEYREQQRKETG